MCRNNDIRRDNWDSKNDIRVDDNRVDDRSNNNRNNSEFEIWVYNWGNFWFGDNFLDFLWMFMF